MQNNDSDHEHEGSASMDPGFSAALANSFKMDYFAETTDSADINRKSTEVQRSGSFSTSTNKPSDKNKKQSITKESGSKLEEILEGKGVFVMNTQPNNDDPTKKELPSVAIDDNEEDSSPELKTRARNERVIFSPSSAQVNNNLKNHSRMKDKSQSILERSTTTSEFEPPSRTFTESFSAKTASMISPKNSTAIKAVNLNSESITFVDKSQWTEDLTCYVCSRAFSKMDRIFTHHCRVCGRSVCGDCSSKKINNDRACDVCYYKLCNKDQEDSRQEMLLNKINQIEAYKQQIIAAEQKLAEMNKKKKDMEKKMLDEMEQKAAGLQVLQDEKTKRQEALQRKKTENQSLKESVEVNRAFLREKEEETQEIREVLNTIKLELAEKKGKCNSKQEEVDRLASQRNYYSQSVCSYGEVQSSGSFYSRDPYFVGSCHPSLPGNDNTENQKSPRL